MKTLLDLAPRARFDSSDRVGTRAALQVLVVEDDDEMRGAIREILLMNELVVNTAADGLTAAEMASRENYDVVVTDIRLPGMDGLDLARRLRAQTRSPKIILITAFPEWKIYEEADAIGVSDILSKPLSLKTLAARVIAIGSGDDSTRRRVGSS